MDISCFLNSVMKEEFFDSVFGEQRAAEDAHDFHDRAIEFKVVFNDSDEAIGDDGHMNLYADGILRFTPECLDSEVLFDPFEEEFHLPSVSIQKCDVFGRKVEVVGVVGKCPLQFGRIVDNPSELCRIVASVVLSSETDCLVSDDVVLAFEEVLSRSDLVFRPTLLADDKECHRPLDAEEPCKVKIPSVKHIACQRLVCKPVHGVDIVDISVGDSVKNRDLRDDVDLGMDSDARFCRTELCPPKNRHAQVDGRRVDGVESSMQLKLFDNAPLLGDAHHIERKFLEDAVVSDGVGLREHLPIDGQTAKSEKDCFISMSSSYVCEFSQASTSKKLAKHQNQQMVPVGEAPLLCPVAVPCYNTPELPLGQECCYLSKYVLTYVHKTLELSSNVYKRISKPGHVYITANNCA